MIKTLVKTVFPEPVRAILRKVDNFLIRLRHGFAQRIILTDVNGLKFTLYRDQTAPIRWLIERGAYAKEFAAMKKLIKSGDTILDIGSHIGIVACYMRNIVGGSGQIHCFEPFPGTFARLKENMEVNDFTRTPSNVTMNMMAVSGKTGSADFYYDPTNLELNSLGQVNSGEKKLTEKIAVQTTTIDTYTQLHSLKEISFAKIDVEGHESDVIKGAENVLSQKAVETIQFEVSELPLKSLGRNPDEIIAMLKTKGYLTYDFDVGSGTFTGPLDHVGFEYNNYYASYRDLTKL
jgi:FkbM family methyltransferase